MPTSCPPPDSCGTTAQVWLDLSRLSVSSSSSSLLRSGNVSAEACVSWGFSSEGGLVGRQSHIIMDLSFAIHLLNYISGRLLPVHPARPRPELRRFQRVPPGPHPGVRHRVLLRAPGGGRRGKERGRGGERRGGEDARYVNTFSPLSVKSGIRECYYVSP